MDLQTVIAAGIVIATAVALVWRGVRALRRPSAGACGGCHACPAHRSGPTVATGGLWNGGDVASTATSGMNAPATGQTTFVTLEVAPRSRPGA